VVGIRQAEKFLIRVAGLPAEIPGGILLEQNVIVTA
jgi:hypothetical protein